MKYTLSPKLYTPTLAHPYPHFRAELIPDGSRQPVASTVTAYSQPVCGVAAAIADGATLANMLEWQALEQRRKEIDRENEEIVKRLRPIAVLSSERQETENAHANHTSRMSLSGRIGRWLATTFGNRLAR